MAADPAVILEAIKERHAKTIDMKRGEPIDLALLLHEDQPRLVAALEAVLEQADDLTRKSEALDAEAEYIAGEHPEAAAVAVLKRERSIAYDECARWFREAIAAALNGGTDG